MFYAIDVAPDPKTMKIAGRERVTLTIRKPVSTIVVNELQTSFRTVTLDGVPAKIVVDEIKQRATFSFGKVVTPGTHELDITYTAMLQPSAQGLFKQSYADMNGKTGHMYG